MKLSQAQRRELLEIAKRKDWEKYHSEIDIIIESRLEELDPEFVKSVKEIDEQVDAEYWYG
jgi:hypothetical protein